MWGYPLIAPALVCSVLGAGWASTESRSRRVRLIETAAWAASVLGAISSADQLWLSRPWAGAALVVAILLLVNGLPAFVITLWHNRKPESQSPM